MTTDHHAADVVEGYHVTSSYTALLQKGQREHPTITPEQHAKDCEEDASSVLLAVDHGA